MPSSQDELAIATEAWGPKLRFGFVRISSKEMYWYAVQNAERDGRDSGDSKSKLLDKFKIFHPKVCKIIDLTSVDRIIRNDIYDLKRLPSWSVNNICLLGDAAHATTPNMGQGACQGIEDAFAIGHELAGVHDHVGSAFQQFPE